MDKLDKSLDEIMAAQRAPRPAPKPAPAGVASRIGPRVDAKGAAAAAAAAAKSNAAGGGGKAAKKQKAKPEPYPTAGASRGTLAAANPAKKPIAARLGPGAPQIKTRPPEASSAREPPRQKDLTVTIRNDLSPVLAAPGPGALFGTAVQAIAGGSGMTVRGRGNVAWDPGVRRMMGGMVADVEMRSGKASVADRVGGGPANDRKRKAGSDDEAAPHKRVQAGAGPSVPHRPPPAPAKIAGAAGAAGRAGAATVKISNLHTEASEQDLRAALSEYGNVVRVSLLYNANQVSTGEAHVVFENPADARRCIAALDGQMADGKTLKCEEVRSLTIAGASKVSDVGSKPSPVPPRPSAPSSAAQGSRSPPPQSGKPGIASRIRDTRPPAQRPSGKPPAKPAQQTVVFRG
ncbi:hypothetical protein DFJ74DRAFT_138232 [Hyaloraphidium curvatum]|nr:hypothetical protein DFJ74DRAFT_138232 [Hyaloraphidium curvatum]